jgi:hypothetical protein
MAIGFISTDSPLLVARLASDPSSPTNGLIYYNTTSNVFRQYQSGAWTSAASLSDLTGYLKADGSVALTGNLVPDTVNTRTLGAANLEFSEGHFVKLVGPYPQAALVVEDSAGNPTFSFNALGPNISNSDIQLSTGHSLTPATDNSGNIGDTSHAFGSAYIINISGSSVTPDTQIGDNSGNEYVATDQSIGTLLLGANTEVKLFAPQLNMNTHKIINVVDPTSAQDAATKNYVDSPLDSVLRIENTADTTKKIAFDASSITTGTTRTITMANANVDLAKVNSSIQSDGSVTFTASQSMGSNKITNLANGTTANDAVNYSQLTSISSGLLWQNSINDPDLVDDSLSTPPGSPIYSLTYIIGSSPTGAWSGFAGHAVWWDGVNWIDTSNGLPLGTGTQTAVQVGDRFGVAISTPELFTFTVTAANATAGAIYTDGTSSFIVQSTITGGTTLLTKSIGFPSGTSGTLTKSSGTGDATISYSAHTEQIGGGLVGEHNSIASVTSNTPGSFTYSFAAPSNNWALNVGEVGSQHFGSSFTYVSASASWVDFSGPAKAIAGNALAYSGNTLDVLFDGITIDLTSNQLEVKAGGISNTQINASAAIAYSKLNLSSSIVNADISGSAAIAYSKLNLSNSIVAGDLTAGSVTTAKLGTITDGITLDQSGTGSTLEVKAGGISNTQINASAAIDLSKLAALSTGKALQSNASTGFIEVSSVTNTELGYVSGVTSAIQTQLNAKAPSASPTFTGTSSLSSGTNTVEEQYSSGLTITGSQTAAAITGLNVTATNYSSRLIYYSFKQTTTNFVRTGTLLAVYDGTTVTISDPQYLETGTTGLSFDTDINGGNWRILYTSGTNGGTLNCRDTRIHT